MAEGQTLDETLENEVDETMEEFINPDDVLAEVYDLQDGHMEDVEDVEDVEELSTEGPSKNLVTSFYEHKKSAFVVACHPTQPLVVSGDEDDLGYIWDLTDGETIVKLTGHTDSVVNAAFSVDGEMIATGGMDGKVRIWRRHGKEDYNTWEFLTELQGPNEITVSFLTTCRH